MDFIIMFFRMVEKRKIYCVKRLKDRNSSRSRRAERQRNHFLRTNFGGPGSLSVFQCGLSQNWLIYNKFANSFDFMI